MAIDLGTTVIHASDGRQGAVVARMTVEWNGKRSDDVNVLVEYRDEADRKAQAWFAESDCTVAGG